MFIPFTAVMMMEQSRVNCLNYESFGRLGENLVEYGKEEMLRNRELLESMETIFHASTSDDKVPSLIHLHMPKLSHTHSHTLDFEFSYEDRTS